MSQKQLLNDIIRLLNSLNVPYYLTGSWALSFYAKPRSTHDIDFVINLSKKDVSRFYESFDINRYMISEQSIKDAIHHRYQFQVTDRLSGFWIDFWIPQEDEFNKAVFIRKKKVKLFNLYTWLPTVEDLIILKTIWSNISGGSEIQRNDVKSIYAIQKDIDYNYIEKWIDRLNIRGEYESTNVRP